MKTIISKTIKLVLTVTICCLLFNCDSDQDINLDTSADLCESAIKFGLNTYDPWSGSTTLYANADYGSDSETAPAIGGYVTYSNASTYNYDLESYHFFNSSTNRFTNIIDASPAVFSNLTGSVVGSTYSHLVYVSGVSQNFIIEYTSDNEIKLAQVNVDSGNIIGASIASSTFAGTVYSLSITTNNLDLVFIGINNKLITFNVNTGLLISSETIELPTTPYNFHGLEYNTNLNRINATRTGSSDETDLVAIDLGGDYGVLHNLSSVGDIQNNSSIKNQFYSTTLNCEETIYVISYLDGNNNTYIQEINISTGEILTTFKEANYYFGLESNANN